MKSFRGSTGEQAVPVFFAFLCLTTECLQAICKKRWMVCKSNKQFWFDLNKMPSRRIVAITTVAALLSGCVGYSLAPLPRLPSFPQDFPVVIENSRAVEQLGVATHPFDARDGLDITEIATLAVVNNPDLRLARAAAGVSAAQSFSAGLLPDPVLNLTRDFPINPAPGATTAFVTGIGYAINSLITHGTVIEASRQDMQQIGLNLLWQEWQVIAQGRLLYLRLQSAARRMALLQMAKSSLEDRYRRTSQALVQGLLTLDAVTPNLTALQDLNKQIRDLERLTNQARFDLNALLGLAPATVLGLQDSPALSDIDPGDALNRVLTLADHRPDLLALKAGYAAQDARYRVALLGQFPTFTLAVQQARDTSNAYTRGFGINLSLPFFNGNRGEIRVQDATRAKLKAEFQQRLNTAASDVSRLLAERAINQRQLQDVQTSLVALHAAQDRMREAFRARNIDALSLSNLEASVVARENERLDIEQSLQEQQVGLQTLVGSNVNHKPSDLPTGLIP